MSAIGQYLKDTRAELRHVAWPSRTQTIVYTLLVAGISLGIAAYLGLFDFLFTTALTNVVENTPAATTPAATTASTTPLVTGANVTIGTTTIPITTK